MVIWIIGLSASGKSTLGKYLYNEIKKNYSNTVFIDGDEMREIFGQDKADISYSIKERQTNANRICKICTWLDRQDINVICSTLSLFEESRNWNKKNYSKYFEIYMSVSMGTLQKRDKKDLYASVLRGETKNVVGIDIPFVPPKFSDYVFDNNSDDVDFEVVVKDILKHLYI